MKLLTPWHDKNGNVVFPYYPIRDRVFLYPDPLPEKLGKEELIFIPGHLRKFHSTGIGTLLSVGPGYWDDKGRWHPTSDQLFPGVKIRYDKTVPWGVYLEGLDGKKHFVVFCGYRDVWGVVEDDT